MDSLIAYCRELGVYGLMLLAFTDSFISPIMPDLLMIPLCLGQRDKAILFSLAATLASTVGGFVGYSLGAGLGPVCVVRFVPQEQWAKIKILVERHGAWAVFWGALMPIPYKFIAISAGVLKLNRTLFLLITLIGRAKRFLLEGILLYYFGAPLAAVWEKYNEYSLPLAILAAILSFYCVKKCRIP